MTSQTGDLTHRGLLRKEADYYILRQSIPYPLAENNAFLVESQDGWTVIDVGIDLPTTRELWERAVKEVGIRFRQINQIYITHCHPDHLGAARWLQQQCDAPVFMLDEEINRANAFVFITEDVARTYKKAIEPVCTKYGFTEQQQKDLVNDWQYEVLPLFPKPYELFPVREGDRVDLAGEPFSIVKAPGHTDGQFMLWSQKRRHLFCADVFTGDAYLNYTDWPNTYLKNPLRDYFKTLDWVEQQGDMTVFPGHGLVMHDVQPIIKKLRRRHEKWMERLLTVMGAPISIAEFLGGLYPLDEYIHQQRLVFAEAIYYLTYLVEEGLLQMREDHVPVLFYRA